MSCKPWSRQCCGAQESFASPSNKEVVQHRVQWRTCLASALPASVMGLSWSRPSPDSSLSAWRIITSFLQREANVLILSFRHQLPHSVSK